MTKEEKQKYLNAQTVAVSNSCGGLEVKAIEYDIDDSIVFVADSWRNKPTVHRARISTDPKGRDYFMFECTRVYMDEILKVDNR